MAKIHKEQVTQIEDKLGVEPTVASRVKIAGLRVK
jgi:hypothetical protein